MIRMTLALLMCIGLTMVMLGRDGDVPMGSDNPGIDVSQSAANPTDLAPAQGLALDDDAGAIERALGATAPTAEADGVQTASLAPLAPMSQLHYVTGNRVNVRAGPSTANEVVDQVVRDQRVEVLEETPDGWVRIRIVDTDREAFIFGRFIKPVNG